MIHSYDSHSIQNLHVVIKMQGVRGEFVDISGSAGNSLRSCPYTFQDSSKEKLYGVRIIHYILSFMATKEPWLCEIPYLFENGISVRYTNKPLVQHKHQRKKGKKGNEEARVHHEERNSQDEPSADSSADAGGGIGLAGQRLQVLCRRMQEVPSGTSRACAKRSEQRAFARTASARTRRRGSLRDPRGSSGQSRRGGKGAS